MPEHCSLQWGCIYLGNSCWNTWDSWCPGQLVLQFIPVSSAVGPLNYSKSVYVLLHKENPAFQKTKHGRDCSGEIQSCPDQYILMPGVCVTQGLPRLCSSFSLIRNYWRREHIMKWIPALQHNLRLGKHKVMKAGSRQTVGKVHYFLQGVVASVEVFQQLLMIFVLIQTKVNKDADWQKGKREWNKKHQWNKNFVSNLQEAKPSNIIFINNHERFPGYLSPSAFLTIP